MALIVTTPPTGLAVSLAAAKLHLRKDSSDEDSLITDLITTCQNHIQDFHGRTLLTTVLKETFDGGFQCGQIRLSQSPVSAIGAVKYLDSDGATQTVAGTVYDHDPFGTFRTRIYLKTSQTWPTAQCGQNSMWVEYTAGYGDEDDVPLEVKQAILLLVGHFYRNREEEITGMAVNKILIGAYALAGMNMAQMV